MPHISIATPPDWADLEAEVQKARDWAMGDDSPDGEPDADSPTEKTMSARAWALYAKGMADQTEAAIHAVAPATPDLVDSAIGGEHDRETDGRAGG